MSGPAIARDIMVANAALTAMVPATRILIGVVPQATALPWIGITETASTDHKSVAGYRGATVKVSALVQITVAGSTYQDCKSAMLKARRALRDYAGTLGSFGVVTCGLEGKGPDFTNDEATFYMQTQDLRITYDESPS